MEADHGLDAAVWVARELVSSLRLDLDHRVSGVQLAEDTFG